MSDIIVLTGRALEKAEAAKNPVGAYLSGLGGPASRRTQLTALRAAIAALQSVETSEISTETAWGLDWHTLGAAETKAIRAAVQKRFSPGYGNVVLAAVRGVIESAWELGLMTSEQRDRAKKVKSIRGERLPAGRDLAPGEIAALMNACGVDEGPAGVRDAALIGLGVTVGFRIAEAAVLTLTDYDHETGEMVLNGKGRKQRKVHAQNGAKAALDDWMELRGNAPGPLFTQIRKSGDITELAISTASLQRMIFKRQAQAGVARFTWHDMRRTTAGDLLDVGADIVTVQKILGHSSPATTAQYDRRPEETKRKAISLLHVPYQRNK